MDKYLIHSKRQRVELFAPESVLDKPNSAPSKALEEAKQPKDGPSEGSIQRTQTISATKSSISESKTPNVTVTKTTKVGRGTPLLALLPSSYNPVLRCWVVPCQEVAALPKLTPSVHPCKTLTPPPNWQWQDDPNGAYSVLASPAWQPAAKVAAFDVDCKMPEPSLMKLPSLANACIFPCCCAAVSAATLVATKTGKAFPKSSSDWQWWAAAVPDKLKDTFDKGKHEAPFAVYTAMLLLGPLLHRVQHCIPHQPIGSTEREIIKG